MAELMGVSYIFCSKEFFSKHRVHSVWSDIHSRSERFTNALYAPSQQAPLLAPSTLSKNIKYVTTRSCCIHSMATLTLDLH
jgi:hypothetical protein